MPKKALAEAEQALKDAETVMRAATKAVDLAREAVKLEAAGGGVSGELLIEAAKVAAKAVKEAEVAALKAWEEAAKRATEHSMTADKARLPKL